VRTGDLCCSIPALTPAFGFVGFEVGHRNHQAFIEGLAAEEEGFFPTRESEHLWRYHRQTRLERVEIPCVLKLTGFLPSPSKSVSEVYPSTNNPFTSAATAGRRLRRHQIPPRARNVLMVSASRSACFLGLITLGKGIGLQFPTSPHSWSFAK